MEIEGENSRQTLPASAGELEDAKARIAEGKRVSRKLENLKQEMGLEDMREKLNGASPLEPEKWMGIINFIKDSVAHELFGTQNEIWPRYLE